MRHHSNLHFVQNYPERKKEDFLSSQEAKASTWHWKWQKCNTRLGWHIWKRTCIGYGTKMSMSWLSGPWTHYSSTFAKVVLEELQVMLNIRVIKEFSCNWSSHFILISKEVGFVWFCNFRKVHVVSKFDPYPVPHMDELLNRLDFIRHGIWQRDICLFCLFLLILQWPFPLYLGYTKLPPFHSVW